MTVDNSMQTISRTVQILKSFSKDEKELSLAELHHKLGLSKSSLQRILNTLVTYGFLEKDNKKKTYKLGIELYYLGKLVEEHSHLLTTAKPYLTSLRDKLGENVYLNIIENEVRKCIAFEEGKHGLATISYVGQTSPLHAGASAKVLLAFQPAAKIKQYIEENQLVSITDATISNKEKLWDELYQIKEKGYAISFGEQIVGVCSVSAPIFNRWNEVIAGLSVSAPIVRVNDAVVDHFITSITEGANRITSELRFVE